MKLEVGQYWKGLVTGNVMRIDKLLNGEITYTILNTGEVITHPTEYINNYIFKLKKATMASDLDKALS
jgi:hypothetical protein